MLLLEQRETERESRAKRRILARLSRVRVCLCPSVKFFTMPYMGIYPTFFQFCESVILSREMFHKREACTM